jgi:hypothetical protein
MEVVVCPSLAKASLDVGIRISDAGATALQLKSKKKRGKEKGNLVQGTVQFTVYPSFNCPAVPVMDPRPWPSSKSMPSAGLNHCLPDQASKATITSTTVQNFTGDISSFTCLLV